MCAKSKSFFGLRRGSTKSLTFQVLDGQQITKDRVTEVRNPRTEKQRIQRVLMNTALRAYSHMQEIVNHSYEGVPYGGKTQQAFIAENIREVRNRLAAQGDNYKYEKSFTPIGQTFVAPNAYVISKGNLPEVKYSIADGLLVPAGATYADVIAAVKAQPGDQLTICVLSGDEAPQNTSFRYCRIILQPQDASGENLPLTTAFMNEGVINMPNFKNENTDSFVFSMADANLLVKVDGQTVLAGGVILSREVNGKWLRSTQKMAYASPKIGFNLIEAVATSTADIAVDDPYYLNNAGDGNTVPVAIVTAVTYGGATLASGANYNNNKLLEVEGSNLAGANVVLFNGEQQYVAASPGATRITYVISTAGDYRLMVNGEVYAEFKVLAPVEQPLFTDVYWDGNPVSSGANVRAAKGSVVNAGFTLLKVDGSFPSGLRATGGVTIQPQNPTTEGGKQIFTNCAVTVAGSGTICVASQVIMAISAIE